jgi:hypothetical protein
MTPRNRETEILWLEFLANVSLWFPLAHSEDILTVRAELGEGDRG